MSAYGAKRGRANKNLPPATRRRIYKNYRCFLFTILISISIITLADENMAQTSATPSKTGAVSTNDNTRPASRHAGVWVQAKPK